MYNLAFTGIVVVLTIRLFEFDHVSQVIIQAIGVFWGSFFCSFAFVLPRLLEVQQQRKEVQSITYELSSRPFLQSVPDYRKDDTRHSRGIESSRSYEGGLNGDRADIEELNATSLPPLLLSHNVFNCSGGISSSSCQDEIHNDDESSKVLVVMNYEVENEQQQEPRQQ